MTEKAATVFRPHEKGLRKIFGDLEAEIMEVLWRRGRATVADVHSDLARRREIAYTTVKTVMTRLAEKGYLRKDPRGKAHVYEPTHGRDAFLGKVGEEVLDSLLGELGESLLVHFVRTAEKEDARSLDRLQALIQERRRQRP